MEEISPKKSITEKKRNYFKATSISTNRFKSAFHTVPEILALAYPLLANRRTMRRMVSCDTP